MALNKSKVKIVGCDIFVIHKIGEMPPLPEEVGSLKLKIVSNRGTKVWPGTTPDIHLTDHFRCRYIRQDGGVLENTDVVALTEAIEGAQMDWVHVEKLLEIDGVAAYSKAQGE